jgi:hypothetical protein
MVDTPLVWCIILDCNLVKGIWGIQILSIICILKKELGPPIHLFKFCSLQEASFIITIFGNFRSHACVPLYPNFLEAHKTLTREASRGINYFFKWPSLIGDTRLNQMALSHSNFNKIEIFNSNFNFWS